MRHARLLFLLTLVLGAVWWRLFNSWHSVLPNAEGLTAVSLLGPYLGFRRWAWPLASGLAGVTDIVIGNSNIQWFTLSAWLVTGAVATLWRRRGRLAPLQGAVWALAASTWFFVWTNFGVWLLGDGVGLYPRTPGGLLTCYEAGLPFWRNMALVNLVLLPALVLAANGVWRLEGTARARLASKRQRSLTVRRLVHH